MSSSLRSISRILFSCLIVATSGAALSTGRAAPRLAVYVATDGDDRNDGSAPARGTDGKGPVRTITRAQSIVRSLRAKTSDRGVDVLLAGGTYVLSQPLRLGPEDSGAPNAPVTYRAEPGASVTLSGGSPVGPWHAGSSGEWIAALDLHASAGICPTQLFVGNQRRGRPRLPSSGTFEMGSAFPTPTGGAAVVDRFTVKAGDLPVGFHPDAATEIVIIDAWTASRLWLARYDKGSRQIDLRGDFIGHGVQREFRAGLPYYIENAPTRQLAPGTWQCDPQSSSIRYQPIPGETPGTLKAVVPRLSQLLVIAGSVAAPVHDVAFRDIAFAHGAWAVPTEGWAAMQAEVGLSAALELTNCHDVLLSGITVEHTGANGIGIRANCANVAITGSHLHDLGGGGISVGSFQRKPMLGSAWTAGDVAKGETTDIQIVGNDIYGLGRIQHAAAGVLSGQASHVRIAENRISDLYYSGISMGWVWNDGPSLSHDNSVTGNVIDHYGQGMMSDFGGIYTLGRQEGTVVSDNRLSNGNARDYGGWGIYADQGSSGIRFERNVISSTSHAGIFVHMPGKLSFARDMIVNVGEAGIRCSASSNSAVHFENESVRLAANITAVQHCESPSISFAALKVVRDGKITVLGKPLGSTAFVTGDR